MVLLLVSPYLPHPLAGHGGGVYLYEMMRRLSAGHDVTLISFADDREAALAKDLASLPVVVHLIPRTKGPARTLREAALLSMARLLQFGRSLALWEPYYVSKFRERRMAELIRRVTSSRRFDIVQLEFTQMGSYVGDVKSGKTVIHEIDVVFRTMHRYLKQARSLPVRLALLVEWCRWNRYELTMVRKFDGVATLTQPDQMLLEWLTGLRGVTVLPPGVEPPPEPRPRPLRDPDALLFVGNLAQIPNDDAARWLCEEIFPRIAAVRPGATLAIIGRAPSAALRAAARDPRIRLLDFVEDLGTYLHRGGVFVAPLRLGGGIKIKMLDAFAYGIPVVTTPVGAEGITGLTSESVKISRTADGLAHHCIALMENPSRAASLAQRGREVVSNNFSWHAVMARTISYYQSLLQS